MLEAYGFPDDALINWVIDGSWLNIGGPVLGLTPDMLDGAQEVCAFYETPECPMGVWACEELEGQMGGCIDESLIDPNMACTEEWNPVCGCDGVTYSNACYATFYGGVTSFEEGECGDDGCIDESLLNPNAICTTDWNPVCGCDGVTYSNACHATNYGGVTEYTYGRVRLDRRMHTHRRSVAQRRAGSVEFPWSTMRPILQEGHCLMTSNGVEHQVVVVEGAEDGITQLAFWGTNDYLYVACASFMCARDGRGVLGRPPTGSNRGHARTW